MVSLPKHPSVSKKAVIIRSKINEKQLVAIIIAELSDKSIHKSTILYTKPQPDYRLQSKLRTVTWPWLVTLLVVNSN